MTDENTDSSEQKEIQESQPAPSSFGRLFLPLCLLLFIAAMVVLNRTEKHRQIQEAMEQGPQFSMREIEFYAGIAEKAKKHNFTDLADEALIRCAKLREPYDIDDAIKYYRRATSLEAKKRLEFLDPYTEYTGEYITRVGKRSLYLNIGMVNDSAVYTINYSPVDDRSYDIRYISWGLPYQYNDGDLNEVYQLDPDSGTIQYHATYIKHTPIAIYDVEETRHYISKKSPQYNTGEYRDLPTEYFYTKTETINNERTAIADKERSELKKKEEEEKRLAEEKEKRERRERDRIIKEWAREAAAYDLQEARELGDNPEDYKIEFGDDWEDYYDYYTEILEEYGE